MLASGFGIIVLTMKENVGLNMYLITKNYNTGFESNNLKLTMKFYRLGFTIYKFNVIGIGKAYFTLSQTTAGHVWV